MNGFMVLARFTMDDVPIRLCADEGTARHVASKVTPKYARMIGRMNLSMDYHSDPEMICVGIIPFINGRPGKMILVRDMEEETAELGEASLDDPAVAE